mmetsp:Transcript_15825/g.28551  ORF Transcript_15825/g.28551 Transcript_15825/m.28551 type:complete len:200 (+) Transcript_15825:1750-2349(+)
MRLVRHGRAARLQSRQIEADLFHDPARATIAARPTTPHVLVGVDEDDDTVLVCFAHHRHEVLDILHVIQSRSSVLDRFPCHEEAQEGEPPRSQPRQVLICLLQRERPPNKRHITVVSPERRVVDIGRSIRHRGDLRGASQVHTTKQEYPPVAILEPRAVGLQTLALPKQRRHGWDGIGGGQHLVPNRIVRAVAVQHGHS